MIQRRDVYLLEHSVINSKENSTAEFASNNAGHGGAIYCEITSIVTFKGNCRVVFNDNQVEEMGGAISLFTNFFVAFIENSNITFYNNTAQIGGAIY